MSKVLFTSRDINQFKRGEHRSLFQKFGAHLGTLNGRKGCWFVLWCPDVDYVSVTGDFNKWRRTAHPMAKLKNGNGIWEMFIPGAGRGDQYQYYIRSGKKKFTKIDPYGFKHTLPPDSKSIVCDLRYRWKDEVWMHRRAKRLKPGQPMSVYELHLGSWRRSDGKWISYRAMADTLPQYLKKMGFTHVEFLPVTEHPFYGSWGYQSLGYFSPTSRYGSPQDFMYLIDCLHQQGIAVIFDWVPSHFPSDPHGLAKFNGKPLYEIKEMHPDWKSCIFDVGRLEVMNFLTSNARFWINKYHIDGIRMDAVASMLYLDYSRKRGEWDPNFFGGFENLDSIAFFRHLNQTIKEDYPEVQLIAEESSAWKGVSRPSSTGGLDFSMKWNLGWMHDTLTFFQQDDKKRDRHLKQLTFSLYYAFNENFLLPLSHDEVVHGKSSLLGKMSGTEDEKFANLRCLYTYMFAHPGKKLLFMGSEIAPWNEWNHDAQLDWELLQYDRHKGIQNIIKDLNRLYRREKALHDQDFNRDGFLWIDEKARTKGVISFVRQSLKKRELILIVCNFKKRPRKKLSVGIPRGGHWQEIFNSDDQKYNGSGDTQSDPVKAVRKPYNKHPYRLDINLPSLTVKYFKKVK